MGENFCSAQPKSDTFIRTRSLTYPSRARFAMLFWQMVSLSNYWVPNSGWITFRIRCEKDLDYAVWLMRLSYLRYSLKTAPESQKLFERETEKLH